MANDPKLQIQIDAFTEGFKKGLAEAGSSLDSFKNKSEEAGEKSSASMFKAVLGANLLVEGMKKLLGFGLDMGKSFVQNAMKIEQVKISFDVLLGSGQKAGQMMKDLANFALATPFELPQLQEGAKKLLAYGISATGILPIMKSLGEVTAAVGTEKLPFLTLALGQVYTAGRLMGSELRQFSENGVPLLGELAKHFNTTTQAVQDMVTKGQIGFKDVAETLFAMTGQGGKFANMMIGQARTVGGMWSNITDAIGQTGNALLGLNDKGEILNGGFFSIMRGGLEQVMNLLMNFKMLVSGQIDFSSFLQLAGFSQEAVGYIIQLGNGFQWLGSMIGNFFQSTIGQGVIFGTAIGGVFFAIASVVAGIVVPIITGALAFLITNPIGWLIIASTVLFNAWQTNWMGIRDVTQNVMQWLGDHFGWFGTFAVFVFTSVYDNILGNTIKFWDFIFQNFTGGFNSLVESIAIWLANILTNVGQTYFNWAKGSSEFLLLLSDLFAGNFKGILERLGRWGQFFIIILVDVWAKMKETGGKAFFELGNIVGQTFANIVNGIGNAVNEVIKKVNELINNPVAQKILGSLGGGGEIKLFDKINYQSVQAPTASADSQVSWQDKVSEFFKETSENLKVQAGETLKKGTDFKNSMDETAKNILAGSKKITDTTTSWKDSINGAAKSSDAFKSDISNAISQASAGFGQALSQTKTDAIKLPEFKLDIKMSDKAMVDMNAQIQKQQEEFLASIKNTAKSADSSGSGKSPADKEADAKQKAMALQKQQIDAEIKQTKDKFDGEVDILEAQKKELENKQKLLQITQEDLKLNTSKSDQLEKQVQALQDQIEEKRQQITDAKASAQDEIQALQAKKTVLEREESQKKLDLQDLVKDTTKSDALKEEIQLLERKATLTQEEKDQLKQLKFDLQDQVQIENDLYDAQKAKANTEIKALDQQQLNLQTQIDSKQQAYQNMDGTTKDLENQLKAKKTELSNTKDQEKADYEASQTLRDKQKKDYELQLFNLQNSIDQKKTDETKALQPLQAKKQALDTQLLSSNIGQFNMDNSAYSIPSFATGVENFGGGLAKVHKGEVLMNLPKGTSVINQDRGQKGGMGSVTHQYFFDGMIIREQADLDYIVNEIGRRFNEVTI